MTATAGATPPRTPLPPTVAVARSPSSASATSPTSPTPPRSSASQEGFFEEALGGTATLETRPSTPAPRPVEALFAEGHRRHLHRPEPGHQRLRPVRRRGRPHRLRHHLRRRRAGRDRRHHSRPRTWPASTLATPSLGNTQDVALRAWLKEQGYETDDAGGGDVPIVTQDNADTLAAFQDGDIDGAWVPEPWATRLVQEGGGHVLVDEADLWPDGEFVTTHLIVRTAFLDEHPDVVKAPPRGPGSTPIDFVERRPGRSPGRRSTPASRRSPTSRSPTRSSPPSWENLTFTLDPIASSLRGVGGRRRGRSACSRTSTSTDLRPVHLNDVLAERGEEELAT